MVHDQADVITGPASPDQVAVVFDEKRLVSDAGLLTASLAGRVGCLYSIGHGVRRRLCTGG
jgi:hypothetical protein